MYMIEFPFTKIVRVYSTAYYRLKKSTADTQGGFPIMGHFLPIKFLPAESLSSPSCFLKRDTK